MFTKLMKLWSEQTFTSRIVDQFVTMLDSSKGMLAYTLEMMSTTGKVKKGKKKIYQRDKTINLTEQDIRKQILIHLSTNPESNLPACLVLMSISKDAERIGDYIKNFFELRHKIGESEKDRKVFVELFEQTVNEMFGLFENVGTAFRTSDQELAKEAVRSARNISRRSEDIIEKVLISEYSARTAVVLALGARYIKRIALHLANIASSVINPLPEVDFFLKKI